MSSHDPSDADQGSGLTYRDAGVDIDQADRVKERIRELARSTFNSRVASEIGAFAGLYRLDLADIQRPVLVASTDGVGTKLKIAFMAGRHDTVGLDLVAHCTNDILVQGAFPLFFLDYIATGKLEPGVIEQIIEGLARGCRQSGCALLGGETAEMPDFYRAGEYDLAGFIVGMVDELKVFSPDQVRQGDVLIGLASSGLHTNGYSLARKVFFEQEGLSIDSRVETLGRSVAEELLTPHRNYLPVLRELVQADDLHGMAHITGGGITGNLNRVLPNHLDAQIQQGTWEILPIFQFIRKRGRIEPEEMYRTFNMGLGMILVAARERADRVQEYLRRKNERYFLVGEIVEGTGRVRYS